MEVYRGNGHPPSVKHIPRIFTWAVVIALLIGATQNAYAFEKEPVIWVQVPQWSDDWAVCAVDIPDAACHWYVANADNTFGEGFDWETAPWFDANGLNDIAAIQKETVVEKIQEIAIDDERLARLT